MNWHVEKHDGDKPAGWIHSVTDEHFDIDTILQFFVCRAYTGQDLLNAIAGSGLLRVRHEDGRRWCGENPWFVATPDPDDRPERGG